MEFCSKDAVLRLYYLIRVLRILHLAWIRWHPYDILSYHQDGLVHDIAQLPYEARFYLQLQVEYRACCCSLSISTALQTSRTPLAEVLPSISSAT